MHAAADFDDFSDLIRRMCVVFGKKATDELVNSYWDALKDLTLPIIERCADNHARYGKFFPKPIDLRPKDDAPATVKEDKDFQAAVAQNIRNWEERLARDPVKGLEQLGTAYAARQQVTSHPQVEDFDKWGIEANQHLLALVLRNLGEKRTFDELQTRILVRYKNLWAEQMRLDDTGEGVPISEQREVWTECMRRAEEEIAACTASKLNSV